MSLINSYDRWMDAWMDGWMHKWMDGWIDGCVGIHRWRCSFWGFQQDCFWINMFLICHKGSYGLSSSPTVLQIFTPRCEDMPETQLWVTIGQWDRHPWPGNKTQLLPLFSLFSLGTSQEVLLALLCPPRLRDLSWGPLFRPPRHSWAPTRSSESSRDLRLNFSCWELQAAAPVNKRTRELLTTAAAC